MFDSKLKSLIDGAEIENAKMDKKSAKRIGQYKVSDKAIYKADGTYLPFEKITEYTHDKTSVHVSGCCAGGVPVERLILDTKEQRFPFIFDTLKDVEKVIEIVEKVISK